MSPIKLITSSSVFLGLSYVLRFLITISLARFLTSSDLGVYSWAITAFGLLSIFTNFGQDNFLLRKIPAYKISNINTLRSVLGFSIRTVLINSSIILSSIYLLTYYFDILPSAAYAETLKIVILALPLCALSLVNSTILRTNDEPLFAQLPDSVIQPTIFLALVYVTIFFIDSINLSPYTMVIFNLAGWILALSFSTICVLFFYRSYPPNFFKISKNKKWSSDSLTIVLGVLAWSLLGRSDVFFLAFLVQPDQLGKYFICMRLAEFLLFFSTISFHIWSGEISNLYQNKKNKEVQILLKKSSRLCFASSIFFFLFATIFAEDILTLLNPEYSDSVFIFQIALIGFLILGCAGILNSMFYIVGDLKFVTNLQFLVGIIFLIIIFISVPEYGIITSAIAFSLCQLIYVALMALRLRSKYQFTISPF